ncbi:dipeptidyl aminopeptidase A [Trichomonascus vanleenenianus]|uniref:dipeptidyl aminopeptidase n=1 Tax=Trichomonascus vanleenenianus TaxID=2268995 RepID=UPI003ECAAC2E
MAEPKYEPAASEEGRPSTSSEIFEYLGALNSREDLLDDKELQTDYRQQKKSRAVRQRTVFVFVGACLTALALLVFAFTTRVSDSDSTAVTQTSTLKQLSLEEMRTGKFQANLKQIRWIDPVPGASGGGDYLIYEDDKYYLAKWSDRSYKQTVLNSTEFEYKGNKHYVDSVELNHDHTKVLIGSDTRKNWRHSTFAKYFIKDLNSGTIEPVFLENSGAEIALAEWSPRGDRIAFIHENNLYLRYVDQGKKVAKITQDGGKDVFYGRPDWVYEEEVFSGAKALWWSQSGEYLAFLRTNDSAVPEFTIPYFAQHGAGEDQDAYPEVRKIKYPKPGYANPIVDILFLEIASEEFYAVPTEKNPAKDNLITEVTWSGSDKVIVRLTNRESDVLKVSLVDARSRTGKIVRTEDLRGKGWFEITHNTKYVAANPDHGLKEDGYIDTIIVDEFSHLAYFSPLDAKDPLFVLTSGNWEVVDAPSAYDAATNQVYFMATKKSPVERHLYSVRIEEHPAVIPITDTGKEEKKKEEKERDGYFSASFSSDAKFALLTSRGPEVPWQKVLKMDAQFVLPEGELVEQNLELRNTLKEYALPTWNHGQVEVAKDDKGKPIVANYVERLPPNFNPDKKYPVLFYVYGGPGSQNVDKRFGIDFQAILAGSKEVIVVSVDGRGTGYMGRKFRSVVRDQLGTYEVHDQIAAAKHWAGKKYVDESRVAIWGWSYGGYMTLKTLEADAGHTFSYGMAVAPVTDWRFYDSIYTERYMHTPEHNHSGYADSRVRNVTAIAQNERFLLMHGTGDDNVHFQNSLVLLDEFDKHGVENYDVHVFPDSDHSIYHHNANSIVYDKLMHWISDAFDGRFKDLE